MNRTAIACTLAAALGLPPAVSAQHEDLSIYSSQNGAGTLVVEGPFGEPILVTPRLPFCPGGICPYSATDPGFVSPSDDLPDGGPFALDSGTRVSIVLVAIDAAASVKIGATVLDAPGESILLGEAPGLHVHPEWQVQAPQGEVGSYPVAFKLTTASSAYAESPVYEVFLSNGSGAAPSPTPTATPIPSAPPATATPTLAASPDETATASPSVAPTATTTAAPPACRGDCDGDGQVTISELITGVGMALGNDAGSCAALDADGDGQIAINELIAAVNSALVGC